MPRLESAIEINAPQERVFDYITDVESTTEWCKWSKEAEVTSTSKSGLGATDEMFMQVGGRKLKVEGIVTEYAPHQYYSRRHTRGMELSESYALEPAGDGTKVSWVIDYTPPYGVFGKVMAFVFMTRLFEQLQGDSLTNLKARLETAK